MAGRAFGGDPPVAILQYQRRVVRVEYQSGADGLEHEEFRLDDPVSKQALADTILSRKIATLHSLEPSLEDVFLNVTGRGLM